MLFNLGPCTLNYLSVLNARRARSFAGETSQAAINMFDERFAHGKRTFVDVQDLVNASARRVHFQAQRFVRRTMIQAESAVDARGEQLPCRLVRAAECSGHYSIATHGINCLSCVIQ